jgi:hypothetical protein
MSEVRKGTSRNTENENKRCKIFNKVLNMNWDYVRVKKNQKENKNKQTKRGKKKIYSRLMLYIPFGCASGNIDHKPGMSHYIPCLIAE